jgi:hypothetical protein
MDTNPSGKIRLKCCPAILDGSLGLLYEADADVGRENLGLP